MTPIFGLPSAEYDGIAHFSPSYGAKESPGIALDHRTLKNTRGLIIAHPSTRGIREFLQTILNDLHLLKKKLRKTTGDCLQRRDEREHDHHL